MASFRIRLIGDGVTDYIELFRQLRKRGYGGFVNVEVTVRKFTESRTTNAFPH